VRRFSHHATILLLWLSVPSVASVVAQTSTHWLDRPLTHWNKPGAALPSPAQKPVATAALARRCSLNASTPASAAAAVTAAGWIPYLHQDRALAREGVDVIAGLSDANAACEPVGFNLFVFVDGRFAGTLSPVAMTTGRDGVAGAVRLVDSHTLTAEFARFVPGDLECCPSTRVRVTYRIDRGGQPAVGATAVQPLR
jgi:LppP/LprE lipoprotein